MPVLLDADGHALAWGERLEGEDIPNPPDSIVEDPLQRPKWDGAEWVAVDVPQDEPARIKNDLQNNAINPREAILRLLERQT